MYSVNHNYSKQNMYKRFDKVQIEAICTYVYLHDVAANPKEPVAFPNSQKRQLKHCVSCRPIVSQTETEDSKSLSLLDQYISFFLRNIPFNCFHILVRVCMADT